MNQFIKIIFIHLKINNMLNLSFSSNYSNIQELLSCIQDCSTDLAHLLRNCVLDKARHEAHVEIQNSGPSTPSRDKKNLTATVQNFESSQDLCLTT